MNSTRAELFMRIAKHRWIKIRLIKLVAKPLKYHSLGQGNYTVYIWPWLIIYFAYCFTYCYYYPADALMSCWDQQDLWMEMRGRLQLMQQISSLVDSHVCFLWVCHYYIEFVWGVPPPSPVVCLCGEPKSLLILISNIL